jgi:hypothetical protein
LALENSLALAEELGMLDAPAEQIVDSTPMLGAAATQDTVRLVRSGVKRLIDAVEAVDGRAARGLADGLEFDYAKPNQKPDCRWRERRERERMLTRVGEDAERALRAVERAGDLFQEEAVKAAHELLRELVGLRRRRGRRSAASPRHPAGANHLDRRHRDAPRPQVPAPALRRLQALGRRHQHGRAADHRRGGGAGLAAGRPPGQRPDRRPA